MLERIGEFAEVVDPSTPVPPSHDSGVRRFLKKMQALGVLFWLTVGIPTMASIMYFGLFASDVYISESRFVIRSPDKPTTSGFDMFLKGAGFSGAGDEIYAAQSYVMSRDALGALNKGGAYSVAYSNQNLSYFDRFGTLITGHSFEDLYKYFTRKVEVVHEASSSITTLTVRAYTPRDAQRFNEQLLEMAEGTVNRLNARGRQDLIRFATAEVENAKEQARQAALALAAYRNKEGVVDPEKQAAVQLQLIAKLQDELISAKTQLVQVRAFAPQNPQIPVLVTRIQELTREIDQETGKVAGGSKSLAVTAAQYQRLSLEAQFADRQLAAAMTALEGAQNEARRKQAYIERIVQPSDPDSPLEPRRFKGVLATFILGLVTWGIVSMLVAGIREHRA